MAIDDAGIRDPAPAGTAVVRDASATASTQIAAASVSTPITPSPSSAAAPIARNRKDHTPDEWDKIRPRFTDLYLTKRLRLADVSRILREEDGFHATDKQFKDRIRKWSLRKNFTGDEKRKALTAASERSTASGKSEQASTTESALIPRRRLQRFARDEKLLYIRHVANGPTLPPEPTAIFDLVVELPRSLFEPGPHSKVTTSIHESLAAVDRQMKLRWPILAMDVLGVSDATVRYGLKRVQRKTTSGIAFELMPPSSEPGNEYGPGIRYAASLDSIVAAYGPEEGDTFHLGLFHTISERLFTACQSIYAPETRVRNSLLSRPGEPPGLNCVKANASALATQTLYLRLLGHSALASSVRYVGNIGDAELISTPENGLAYRIEVNPTATAYMTVKPGMHVALHIVKKGNLLAGVTRFCRGHETSPLFMGGHIEHEATKMNLMDNPSEQPDPEAAFYGPLLAVEDDAVEPEFKEMSQRAAQQNHARSGPEIEVAVTDPTQPIRGPLSRPQRAWLKAASEDCIVDRNRPWNLAVRTK